jgi:phospholipid/cholesterol/gamma-HCH transport system substrate-binding protein
VSDDLQQGKGTAGRLLKDEELAKKIDTTMTKLAALTGDLEAGRGTAGKFLKDESLYNNANQMLEETQGLIKAIRENPKKYLSIKLHVF